MRPCAPSAPGHKGDVSTWSRNSVTPRATLPRHAPVTARTLRRDRRHRAPRHDVAHITKCVQSKCSLDNLGNAGGILESGMYNSRQAPRGRPCRASSWWGEGRLRRWSDDYRALCSIWARTWRRCHGKLVINQLPGTRAATQDPSGSSPRCDGHYMIGF